MHSYHPKAYLYPIVRACGGSHQDFCVKGAPAVLMYAPNYVKFLNWCLSIGGKGDLGTVVVMLQSLEVIALLCVLLILHIAICLPTQWLAG